MIKELIYRWLLPRLINRVCESQIPRSGKKGEEVNCYVVALDQSDSPYFVATAISGDVLIGLKYDGKSYADKATIPISDLKNGTLRITHYYGLSEVIYDSIYDAAWQYLTKLIYLKIHIYRYIDSTFQYFFNKRKLVTKRRMELLRLMMEDQLDSAHDGIDSLDLMSKLYSMRLFSHPSWEVQHKKLELYLDSLVSSGELRKVNSEYVVSGEAISTIEKYEEDERRHTEAVKLQRKMLWLTIIAVIFAIVQSGLIKLPTIIDFSNISGIEGSHNEANKADAESRTAD
ncbi:hypothetical protein [Sedimenticola selenatireducens]|uniref:hypothetical protein n=1 Tax=Sedimenticola selenatireducens TaxID=191960 RepID=UPI00048A7D42|nr:hypothetical protein [Sedimenticola selenatireducens]